MKKNDYPACILGVAMVILPMNVQGLENAREKRLDEVAERGALIMPFDLEQTKHVFTKNARGGVQRVVVKDSSMTDQVARIRAHLLEISESFSRGDFSSPEKIHGESMPGLDELKKAEPGRISFVFSDLSEGAQIEYSTDSPKLIHAIHRWFDAQLSDHARHAVPGHAHHLMHSKSSDR